MIFLYLCFIYLFNIKQTRFFPVDSIVEQKKSRFRRHFELMRTNMEQSIKRMSFIALSTPLSVHWQLNTLKKNKARNFTMDTTDSQERERDARFSQRSPPPATTTTPPPATSFAAKKQMSKRQKKLQMRKSMFVFENKSITDDKDAHRNHRHDDKDAIVSDNKDAQFDVDNINNNVYLVILLLARQLVI